MRFATGVVLLIAGLLLMAPSAFSGLLYLQWAMLGAPQPVLAIGAGVGAVSSLALIWLGAWNAKAGWRK